MNRAVGAADATSREPSVRTDMSGCSRLAALALMALGGCKESIPDSFESFVPDKGRDDISMATETDGKSYGADKMLIVTYGTKLSDAEINDAYAETITGQGFAKVLECKDAEGHVSAADYLKAPREHVQVFFRLRSRDETGPMLHVFHTSKVAQLQTGGETCKFTDAAADLCKHLDGRVCSLTDD